MSDACPPFVTMHLLKQLFPTKHEATVWRWNTVAGKGNRLPASDLDGGPANPIWSLDTILDWAERTGLRADMDEGVLSRIMDSV